MMDVEAEALFLAVIGNTLNDVETKALVFRLSGMLPEEKAEIVLNTLATWTPRHWWRDWLIHYKKERPRHLATVKETANTCRVAGLRASRKRQTLANTLGNVNADALVHTLANRQANVKAHTLGDTLRQCTGKDTALPAD